MSLRLRRPLQPPGRDGRQTPSTISTASHSVKQKIPKTDMARRWYTNIAIGLLTTALLLGTLQTLLSPDNTPASLWNYPSPQTIKKTVLASHNMNRTRLSPPFYTEGRYIVDINGQRVHLASVNWYGASDEQFVVGGLNTRHRRDIATTIRQLGFNSVRLPYSDHMVRQNPAISHNLLEANPDLVGLPALNVFAAVVKALTAVGLSVIINDHITSARWCCDANLCDGEWANDHLGPLCAIRQTQEDWISNLETVMSPHIDNPFVIGVDLRNEVRGIRDRFLWSSWADAAEAAAERLHLLQPNWLMFVEGVSSANILSGARQRPVKLSNLNKVVYSAHVYGWSGWGTLRPYWRRSWKSFHNDMHKNWAFLLDENIAPVWVGEFGAPHIPNKGDLHYWKNLVRFLDEMDVDFGYWALNPRKPHNNEPEGYGLLEDDWETLVYDYRLYDMARLAHSAKEKERLAEQR